MRFAAAMARHLSPTREEFERPKETVVKPSR